MDFKKLLSRFAWKPEKEYSFSLPDTDKDRNNIYVPDKDLNITKKVFPRISQNLDYIKFRFNTLINNDIIIRQFVLTCQNRHYKAFLLFIDGMVDSDLISNYVLKPLMLKNTANSFKDSPIKVINENFSKGNTTIRKIKKIDIGKYILNRLIPENNVSIKNSFDDITSSVNSGNCILFVDTVSEAFDIDVKGFKQRSVSSPNNEVVIKGPQEAFVENIRTNTSLLRRIVNSEKLVIESVEVGSLSKTKCAICYLENIANDDLVAEVKYRVNNLDVDSLLSTRNTRGINYRWKSNWDSRNYFN